MKKPEIKSLDAPEEVRLFDKGRIDLVKFGDRFVGRATFFPGWKWSESVKSIAGTETCQAPHFQYHISGVLKVRMDNGTEIELGPGDVAMLPPGHDAWVVGNEPVVVVDFQGLSEYAKLSTKSAPKAHLGKS